MKIECEYCGLEWNTTGDIHGIESCRERMRDMLRTSQQGRDNNRDAYYAARDERDVLKRKLYQAEQELEGWKKGVRDANRISQEFEGRARKAEEGLEQERKDKNAWLQKYQERVRFFDDRLHDMELDFRHSCDEYEKRLHHATSEWQEEKKRARECEKECKENEGVIKALRRHRDTSEQFLVDLFANLSNYNSATDETDKSDWLQLLNEKMDEVKNYLGSIVRM